MSADHTVYVVHCVDTEGPLCESVEATFERIERIFGISLPPSRETLARLQRCEIDLGGQEEAVATVVAPHLLDYKDTWDKIDAMLEQIGSDEFRKALPDSDGSGWIYNWHCVDHVGYLENPRRRTIGYHAIFDHYRRFVEETQAPDGIHWHFHPTHPSLKAHLCATSYLRDTKFLDCLARRLIDRSWFPSVNRAGFHVERPDSHWLLEQWIPFDVSNLSYEERTDQGDVGQGRLGDWRRAPRDWSIYHPAHDDYQIPGNCRRYIARCLNVGTRYALLDEAEVRKAFERARNEGPTLMAFTDHDFRDMAKDVEYVQELLRRVTPEYPEVRYIYSEVREAMNRVLFGESVEPAGTLLSAHLDPASEGGTQALSVTASEPTFGPQPFLAIRTKDGHYYHDNFDFQEPFRRWTYVFDEMTFPWEAVNCVAIGSNDGRGFPHVVRLTADGGGSTRREPPHRVPRRRDPRTRRPTSQEPEPPHRG